MARNTKRGKCELCGEMANVGTNHGSATCTKCTHVQAALANRLQAVAKAARAMGKAEDLIKALIPDGGSLAVQVTATLLQEISGIVGYDGEDPAELVEAVRKATQATESSDCGDDTALRDDLMRACGFDKTQRDLTEGCELVSFAAIQTIAELTNRRDDLLTQLTYERANNAGLRKEIMGQRTAAEFERIRADLIRAEQDRDKWEQRAMQAEANVADQAAELDHLEERLRDMGEEVESYNRPGLLDIAIAAMRGEPVPAEKIADLLAIARGRMA